MQKLIKTVDEEKGIVQVTVADERWYFKSSTDQATGNPIMKAFASATWIAGFYPKGIQFYKWLAEKGWDESQAIKSAAGDKGSKVHLAISAILRGEEVRIDSKFVNPSTGNEEELTFEEVECILSFLKWKKDTEEEFEIESIIWDKVVFSEKYDCAGTMDWLVKLINRKTKEVFYYILDFKTSQYIWVEYEIQTTIYKRMVEGGENPIMHNGKLLDVSNLKIAILQIGYKRNKNKYKFTEIKDAFPLFQIAQAIWKKETEGQAPRQVDIPIVLSPAIKVDEIINTNEQEYADVEISGNGNSAEVSAEATTGGKVSKGRSK